MHRDTNRLPDGRRGAVCEGHEPGFGGRRGERGDGGDAGAKGEAFKGLVEGDGDEQNNERGAGADGKGHPDKDGVEEDAGFEEEALEEGFLLELVVAECRGGGWRFWLRGGWGGVDGVGVGGCGVQFVEVEVGVVV